MLEEGDLLRILDEEYSAAESYYQTSAEPAREKALDYYLRNPRGDEVRGRSQVIASEVFKTVEGISTAIVNLFVNEDSPVEFIPRSQGDEEKADLRTKAVLYYIENQANGFNVMNEAIKDGVLSKTGYITWRWEKKKTVRQEIYKNQTPQSLELLQDNDDVTIVSQEEGEPIEEVDPQGLPYQVPTFNVVCKITETKGRAVLEAIPPEEILVSPRAKSEIIELAPVVIWRTLKSKDDLLMMGYAPDVVEQLGFADKNDADNFTRDKDYAADWTQLVEIRTFWLYLDLDEDGVFEYRKIVMCDDQILSNEITDELNIAAWCPNPMPHEFYGRCPADEAIEAQDMQTAIWRQSLDKLYLANRPMIRTSSDTVLAQLMRPEIGRPFHAKQGDMEVLQFPADNSESFQMLEYAKSDNENTTGFTRYAQGMDSDSLNQTATGVKIITNMSQERVKKMARHFGRCWARACQGISKLLSQNCDKSMQMRLSDNYVEIDPREWTEEYDMVVKVGLGMPDKQERTQAAIASFGLQQNLAQITGGTVVSKKNLYNGALRQLQALGEKSPMLLVTDPDSLPPPPPPDPMQDPEVIKTQMKIQAEGEAQKYKIDQETALSKYKIDADANTKMSMQSMSNQAEMSRNELMRQPAANINMDAAQPINDLQAAIMLGMEQTREIVIAAMSQTQQAIAALVEIQAAQLQKQSQPMTATLSNGKTITVQNG